MPSAIGGLTPEYRGADIRCGLNERLGCGTLLPFADAANASAESVCTCGDEKSAMQRFSPNRTFKAAQTGRIQTAHSLRYGRTGKTRDLPALRLLLTNGWCLRFAT